MKKGLLSLVAYCCVFLATSHCSAATLEVVWSIKKQVNLPEKFTIYYGLQSRFLQNKSARANFSYDNLIVVPRDALSPGSAGDEDVSYAFSFDNVTHGSTYYVSITASYAGGVETGYSDEASVRSESADSALDESLFDLSFYLNRNTDLLAQYGLNYPYILDHWLVYGLYEGRASSPSFDPQYYLQMNPDVQAAYGNDFKAVASHWQNFGIDEGRVASPVFDVHYYLQANPDLFQAFGSDYPAALEHWLQCGIHEGRIASPYFNVKEYLQNNEDVFNSLGYDYKAATWHYLIFGIREGR